MLKNTINAKLWMRNAQAICEELVNRSSLPCCDAAGKQRLMSKIKKTRISEMRFFSSLAAGLVTAIFSAVIVAGPAHSASTPVKLIEQPQAGTAADTADEHRVTDYYDGSHGVMARPLPRPDYLAALGGQNVDIEGPQRRPSLSELLPAATADIAQMVARETGNSISSVFNLTLSSGETLAKILKRAKFSNQDIAQVSQALSQKVNLRRLQVGTRFTAALDNDGRAVALQLHLGAAEQKDPAFNNVFIDHYVLRHDDVSENSRAVWHAIRAIRPVDIRTVHAGNEIDLSLYEAAKDVNIPVNVLDEFVRVMSFSVDFQREIQQGDQFELVFDNAIDRYTEKPLTAGKLQYAGIVLSGRKMGFYRFVHPNGKEGWYDRNGESAVRTLMRTPVNGARFSSGYGMRRHPVTGYSAMHKGIDFAVPKGTPVLAAGSGHIEMAGWNGGYGRYIRIRHNSTYKTAYAHLSRIAASVRAGRAVQQGEVIGYVGSTGRSTGPHLHYEILVNNRQLNPLTVKLPSGEGLPAELKDSFLAQVKHIESKMRSSVTPLYAGISVQQAALTR